MLTPRCDFCGHVFAATVHAPAPAPVAAAAWPSSYPASRPLHETSVRFLLPVGRTGWSIAAGYAGLFAILFITSPIALVLGGVALWDLRRRPHLLGRGRAWFATIIGAIGTLGLIAVML